MEYYTVYKITNLVNGKIYIGCHKTNDLDDDYMGSGKLIKRAISKHGEDNFEKEYLAIFDNAEAMFNMEAALVDEEFVVSNENYNLKRGGEGGFDYLNSNGLNNSGVRDISEEGLRRIGVSSSQRVGKLHSYCKLNKLGVYSESFNFATFKGRNHTDETKSKIGEANSIHQKGEKNSQYGTRWIHSLELKKSKRIKKDESLPDGWIEGRKMKF